MMHSCQEIAALASDYLEGRLGVASRTMVKLHLSMCETCRRYVGQLQQVIAAAVEAVVDPRDGDVDGLVAALMPGLVTTPLGAGGDPPGET